MRLLLYTLSIWHLMACTACGAEEPSVPLAYDNSLTPYVFEFQDEMAIRGIPRTIGTFPNQLIFKSLDEQFLGECFYRTQVIHISPSLLKAPERILKEVVFHELTHCMYDISEHDEERGYIFSEYSTVPLDASWTQQLDRLAAYIKMHLSKQGRGVNGGR